MHQRGYSILKAEADIPHYVMPCCTVLCYAELHSAVHLIFFCIRATERNMLLSIHEEKEIQNIIAA